MTICANNIITLRQMDESLRHGFALGCKFGGVGGWAEKTSLKLEKETGLQHRTIYRYINLKYLSPRIVRDIFENRNLKNIKLAELMALADKYFDFPKQEEIWG